jgi:hypothetical protein
VARASASPTVQATARQAGRRCFALLPATEAPRKYFNAVAIRRAMWSQAALAPRSMAGRRHPAAPQPIWSFLMNTQRLAVIATLVVAASALLAAVPAAQARERQVTVTGSKGKTATRSVARSGGDVSSSTTGPNGKTRSRSVDRSASGVQATLTGPNGQTATRSTTKTDTGSSTTTGKATTMEVIRQP